MKCKRNISEVLLLLILMFAQHGTFVHAETFKWAFQSDVATMDPHSLYETMTLGFQGNIYESLVLRNQKMELIGGLARDWKQIEPTAWRFYLREDVKFHNGNTFAADDVLFSAQRILSEGSNMGVIAALFEEVRIVSDFVVDIITPTPNPILPLQLELFMIMDKQWSESNGTVEVSNIASGEEDNYANLNANGTGPFMLKLRENGVKTVLVSNNEYWGKDEFPTNVTEAIFTPIEQAATRMAALLSGSVDMVYPVPIQDWQRLEESPSVVPLTGAEARTIYLGFDQMRDELVGSSVEGENPFKDVRVRKAFMHAIDIDAVREKIMKGTSRVAGLMVAPQINGYNSSLDKRLPYDVYAAQQLMNDAGYEDGFDVVMDCPNDRYVNDVKICQAIAVMLSKISVNVKLLAQTKTLFFNKVLAQNNYDTSFFLFGWTPSTFDSHNVIATLLACRDAGDGLGLINLGGYCNTRINQLSNMIQVESDHDKRQAMIDEAFQIHRDEVGHIPLHQQPLSWGVDKRVSVFQRPDNRLDLRYAIVNK